MTGPLCVLAALAALAGFANIHDGVTDLLTGWLPERTHELITESRFKLWIAAASTGAGVAGLTAAWLVYGVRAIRAEDVRSALQPLPDILDNKYYLDALYEDVIVRQGVLGGVAWIVSLWDRYVVDGAVNGVAGATRWASGQLRFVQTGQAQMYAAMVLLGVAGAIAGILLVNPP
jgi:NADH-quinone oxidoreductase subunit L